MCLCESYPERVSIEVPHHQHEQRLLQQSKHSADHRLHASQRPKVVGRIAGDNNNNVLIRPTLSLATKRYQYAA